MVHEFFHALTHADKGFLFLIKEMLYRPGYVAAEYIEGKRKKYFNPLSFLVIATALWALIVLKSGYFESMGSAGPSREGGNALQMPAWMARYFAESMRIILTHGKIISLIITVPVLSFLSWIFFRKKKNTFAENLVLQSLNVGLTHLSMVLIFVPAFLLFGNARLNDFVHQVVFLVYLTISYQQFFKNHWIVTILKALLIHVLFIFSFWLLIFGFVFIREQF